MTELSDEVPERPDERPEFRDDGDGGRVEPERPEPEPEPTYDPDTGAVVEPETPEPSGR